MPDTRADEPIQSDDIKQLVGDIADADAAAIMATKGTRAELEQAWLCVQGYGDVVDRSGHPLTGAAAQIFEILESYREDEPAR
jgi:benzoyl-CoA reductase/2-hydroxyglutaryl-CoA dehydratase subunit BcrC/BadD/HgdB